MIENFPIWVDGLFILACLGTLIIFYYSNGKPSKLLLLFVLWSIAQSILAFNGFYLDAEAKPPRAVFILLPTFLMILWGLTKKSRKWIGENRNMRISIFLHTVRIPVEISLFYLFTYGMVPELMTFEGRNFDILAGITALVVGPLFLKNRISNQVLLIWNIICLALVVFILVNGLLSAETPIQQFAFDQPNRALLYFPYILLPALVVPVVIYTHITDIILLLKAEKG